MTDEYASYICYDGSVFGYFIANLALSLGVTVWYGVKGLGYYDREIVIFILSASWIPQVLLNILLQETFQEEKLCHPHADNGDILYGNPSFETQMFFSFAVFVISFNYLRNGRMQRSYFYGLIWLCFFIVWALWWSGNYILRHLLVGMFFGSVVGLFMALSIQLFLREDFEVLLNTSINKRLGFCDTLCSGNVNDNSTQDKTKLHNIFFIEDCN